MTDQNTRHTMRHTQEPGDAQQHGDAPIGGNRDTVTLIIDTSFGSTVGVLGHTPIVESDSRSHVERLQPNIARAMQDAGVGADRIGRIVVGVGPAPFTGLRAGIVAAKAIAYASGAELLGQDILEVQHDWMRRLLHQSSDGRVRHVTLAVNDARRHQLYYALYMDERVLMAMDIDFPADIVRKVIACLESEAGHTDAFVIDIVGHGAQRYSDVWATIQQPDAEASAQKVRQTALSVGRVIDQSVLDQGEEGLAIFAQAAVRRMEGGEALPAEPLYLRRPDVSVPKPLKQVLHHPEHPADAHAHHDVQRPAATGDELR
ncbi:MAG: tRNA (adenosine(37)-N6)-threonylcarbamoyltransferase complex dimerization subunit type 1 TsaB [Bifidobacterium psychraerophilum]|uniref:tRNA (adenosine(37)-N6)-threonylcarbamoyltransferase complex dimerization subunit type 1 TsaB n=1 Tax=Bifidobacterium psychraerophilum TaxID=218140 RepID=UPI0039E7F97C